MRADALLARALVVVRVATPFVMEGSRYDHVRGVGVVVDKQLGIVIVSRGIGECLLFTVTFYMHLAHNLTRSPQHL